MKKNFFISSLIIGSLIFVSSCKKKDDEPSAPAGSTDVIATASSQAHDDIVSLTSNEGASAVTSISDIIACNSQPFVSNRMAYQEHQNAGVIYKERARQFRGIFLPNKNVPFRTTAGSDQFVLANNVGTYDFHKADSTWTFTNSPSDKVIVNFPSDTASSANNATLTIYNYTETISINNPGQPYADTSYLPTLIDADMFIGGTKYVDVDFSATYNADGNPSTMNYTLFLKPFTNTLIFTDGGSSITLTTSLAKEGEANNILSNSSTITFYDATKDSVTYVEGYVQYRGIKISGTIDVGAISADGSFTSLNANTNIDVFDYSNSTKVGDIIWVDNAGVADMWVKFPDGTSKLAEDYFAPVTDELENFMTGI